jgi:hypothetical protein
MRAVACGRRRSGAVTSGAAASPGWHTTRARERAFVVSRGAQAAEVDLRTMQTSYHHVARVVVLADIIGSLHLSHSTQQAMPPSVGILAIAAIG